MMHLIDFARELRLKESDEPPSSVWMWLAGRHPLLFCRVPTIHADRNGDFVEQANHQSWNEIVVETDKKHPGSVFLSGDVIYVRSFEIPIYESSLSPECEDILNTWIGLHDYPCIDDMLASRLKYDSQIASIEAAWLPTHTRNEEVCPEDWSRHVWRYIWDKENREGATLFTDSGFIDGLYVQEALIELGWVHLDADEWMRFLSKQVGVEDGTKPEP